MASRKGRDTARHFPLSAFVADGYAYASSGIVTLIQVRRREIPHGCAARIISPPGTCWTSCLVTSRNMAFRSWHIAVNQTAEPRLTWQCRTEQRPQRERISSRCIRIKNDRVTSSLRDDSHPAMRIVRSVVDNPSSPGSTRQGTTGLAPHFGNPARMSGQCKACVVKMRV